MAKLDHLGLFVADVGACRDWYTSVIGMIVEFESADPPAIGLQDDNDFTLILSPAAPEKSSCSIFFQVDNVMKTYDDLHSRGIEFLHQPQNNAWGFGAELLDPDGRLVGLWDEKSMKEHAEQ